MAIGGTSTTNVNMVQVSSPQTRSSGRTYHCDKCEKTYRTPNGIYQHKLVKHPEKKEIDNGL